MRQNKKSGPTDQQRLLVENLELGRTEIDRRLAANWLAGEFKRPVWPALERSLVGFAKNPRGNRSLILAGPRGVGKTALLARLYCHRQLEGAAKFYLSLDWSQLAMVEPTDVLAAVSAKLGRPLARNKRPVFIFVDEPSISDGWLTIGQILARRRSRLFLVIASSTDPNRWRQAASRTTSRVIRLGPLSLAEANFVKTAASGEISAGGPWPVDHLIAVAPEDGPGQKLRAILSGSSDSFAVYSRLEQLGPELDRYWQDQDPTPVIDSYLTGYDQLPGALAIRQEYQRQQLQGQTEPPEPTPQIRDQIRRQLDQTYSRDPAGGDFPGLRQLAQLLLRLANSRPADLDQLGQNLGLSRRVLANQLDRLAEAGLLTSLAPAEGPAGRPRQPSHYLFALAGLRQALSQIPPAKLQQQLVGDIIADCLLRLADGVDGASVSVGSGQFIFQTRTRQIAIATETRPPNKLTPIKPKRGRKHHYRLVLTDKELRLDEPNQTVFVPLTSFLLL